MAKTLTNCLRAAKLAKEEKQAIRSLAGEFQADGLAPQEAAQQAVQTMINDAMVERATLGQYVREQGGTVADYVSPIAPPSPPPREPIAPAPAKIEAPEAPADTATPPASVDPDPNAAVEVAPDNNPTMQTLNEYNVTVTPTRTRKGREVWEIRGLPYKLNGLVLNNLLKARFTPEEGGRPQVSWYGKEKTWTVWRDHSATDTPELVASVLDEGRRRADVADDTRPRGGPEAAPSLEQLRQREDARADERRTGGDAAGLVSAGTIDLLRRGERVGIPADVINDQVEDVGFAVNAFNQGKKLFILANEAGSGKTFVNGGILRELGRHKGPKIYVTMNKDLITQIQRDLADYDIGDVQFVTYTDLSGRGRKKQLDTTDAILIFDETHNIKNAASNRGVSGAAMMAPARFSIFASATPFENPVQAQYLEPTGIFDSVGGFNTWAKMYGASVRKFRDAYGRMLERIYWSGGRKADGLAAREWFFRQGIMTYRPMRIPADMVTNQFYRENVSNEWVTLYNTVEVGYDGAMRDYEKDPNVFKDIARHREGLLKRILEASKVDMAVQRARALLDANPNQRVVLFVETKADREIGRFRRTNDAKGPTYSYAEMVDMMAEWEEQRRIAREMGDKPPPRPFAEFIMAIAKHMDMRGIRYDLPSVVDTLETHLSQYGIAEYTGNVSLAKASSNLESWRQMKNRVLIATMAKGGTGLSLHDTVGGQPVAQVGLNLPWVASQVDQVAGRTARYGLQSPAHIEWIFASNIPQEVKVAQRVGGRMRDMGALVKGLEVTQGDILAGGDFDFQGARDVTQRERGKTAADYLPETDEAKALYERAARMERTEEAAEDTRAGFFQTPFRLAAAMTRIAGVTPNDKVLEPSAGHGRLLTFLPNQENVTAFELRADNYQELLKRHPDITAAETDFVAEMEWLASFDVVLMNPPFERIKGVGAQDVAHVQKAYDHLRPGGRLVAIMGEGAFFRKYKQETEFRDWLEDVGAHVIELPQEMFKTAGTGVKSRLVVIDKDGSSGRNDMVLENLEQIELLEQWVPDRQPVAYSIRGTPRLRIGERKLEAGAQDLEAFRDWYDRHKEVLGDLFDLDGPLFEKLLAATSANTGLGVNVDRALMAYEAIITDTPFPKTLSFYGANLDAIRSEFEAAKLSGPKVSAYDRALQGRHDSVVVDRHIAQLFFGVDVPTVAMRRKATEVVNRIAKRLNWTPRETQAALWAYNQVLKGKKREAIADYGKELSARADRVRTLRDELQAQIDERRRTGLQPGGGTGPRAGSRERASPTKPAFRRADTVRRGGNPGQVEAWIGPILERWHNRPDVNVVPTYDGLPDNIKRSFRDRDTASLEAAYDGRTVYLVADALPSRLATERVLTHELLGHYAIEEVLGPEFTGFVNQIQARKDSDTVIRSAATFVRQQYGELNEFAESREIIARLAEQGVRNSLMDRIVQAVRTFLRQMGVTVSFSHRDIYSVLSRAARHLEQKPPRQETGQPQIVGNERATREFVDREIVFSLNNPAQGAVPIWPNWHVPPENLINRLARQFQDKARGLKQVQTAIREAGGDIIEAWDAYLKDELLPGRVGRELDHIQRTYVDPLTKAVAEADVTWDDLSDYVYAKYAPYRNEHVHAINPLFKEQGLSGSGMTDQEALATLDYYEANGKTAELEALAARVYEIAQIRRDLIRTAGLESNETIDNWENTYGGRFYVPLRGDAEKGGWWARLGRGYDIRGGESKRALGRVTRAEDPVAYTIAQLQETVIRAHKNEVGQALVKQALHFPNDEVWKLEVQAPRGLKKKARWNDRNREVEYVTDWNWRNDEELMSVKFNGREVWLRLKDHRLQRWAHNLGPDTSGRVWQMLQVAQRYLAAMRTSYSPEFVFTNFARDLQTALINLIGEQSAQGTLHQPRQIGRKVVKAMPAALKAAYRVQRDPNAQGVWEDWYREYEAAGGKVGYLGMEDISSKLRKLKRDVAIARGGSMGTVRKGAREFIEWMEAVNSSVETIARLGAYRYAREAGLSQAKSASLARNLTVNFNRKGEYGTAANALYLFYNASLQGTVRMIYAWRSPGVKKIMGGILAFGAANTLWNLMMGGEDEDGEPYYRKISEATRQRNMIFMNPFGGGGYWKIPLPYGYNLPYVVGESIMSAGAGDDFTTGALRVVDTALESFNPLGTDDSDTSFGWLLKMALPTMLDPVYELGANENWLGHPIRREQPDYQAQVPNHQLYFNSVSPASKWATKAINDLTRGHELKPGLIDVNPENIDHIIAFLFGSAGRSIYDSIGLFGRDPEKPVPVRSIPLVRRFLGEPVEWRHRKTYYANRAEMRGFEQDMKWHMRQAREQEKPELWSRFKEENADQIRLLGLSKKIDSSISKLSQRQAKVMMVTDEARRKEAMKTLDDTIEQQMIRFNRAFSEAQAAVE